MIDIIWLLSLVVMVGATFAVLGLAPSRGRARILSHLSIPAGSATVRVTDSEPITIAAGIYFPADLLATRKTNLDAAGDASGVFTVASSLDGTETGMVTISHAISNSDTHEDQS